MCEDNGILRPQCFRVEFCKLFDGRLHKGVLEVTCRPSLVGIMFMHESPLGLAQKSGSPFPSKPAFLVDTEICHFKEYVSFVENCVTFKGFCGFAHWRRQNYELVIKGLVVETSLIWVSLDNLRDKLRHVHHGLGLGGLLPTLKVQYRTKNSWRVGAPACSIELANILVRARESMVEEPQRLRAHIAEHIYVIFRKRTLEITTFWDSDYYRNWGLQ